jgi:hypothetical protein
LAGKAREIPRRLPVVAGMTDFGDKRSLTDTGASAREIENFQSRIYFSLFIFKKQHVFQNYSPIGSLPLAFINSHILPHPPIRHN